MKGKATQEVATIVLAFHFMIPSFHPGPEGILPPAEARNTKPPTSTSQPDREIRKNGSEPFATFARNRRAYPTPVCRAS